METRGIVFVGPAGVGKTSLWQAFASFLEREKQFSVLRVNLDPGADFGFNAIDYDVTADISSRQLMADFNWGPNGAILEASRQLYLRQEEILPKVLPLPESPVDYVLIDTPGQLDSFVLQPFGATFLNNLNGVLPLSAIYLYDAGAMQDPVNVPAQLFLNAAASFQFDFDVTTVLNKADAVVELDEVLGWLQDPETLVEIIRHSKRGVLSDLAAESLDALAHFRVPTRILPISALEGHVTGLDDLFDLLEEQGCSCGDRT
ncbi:MAG TPA: ATP/GTP-binding protein [Candidatus Lokiarchaeia archaeon]|nr:ATP/GTP-binding protein [Candidatus Lokiarchaeia archaeon]